MANKARGVFKNCLQIFVARTFSPKKIFRKLKNFQWKGMSFQSGEIQNGSGKDVLSACIVRRKAVAKSKR